MNPTESSEKAISPRVAAFAVHLFTACGAACALLALIAAVSADWPKMFVWLGIALIIDGVDGTFARRLHVAEVLPRWSGDANFMTVVGETRIEPEDLTTTYEKLRKALNG